MIRCKRDGNYVYVEVEEQILSLTEGQAFRLMKTLMESLNITKWQDIRQEVMR
jgi:hypothetical protein